MLFLISGAAASGKTTVARALLGRPSELEAHDADEIPVATARERWEALEAWVQRALAAQAQGADFLLAAHSPLGELLTCPSAPRLNGIAACLLDCDDLVRLARLRARGIDPRWPPSQHTFNWASWHRLHAADPQWEPGAILHACPYAEHLPRWAGWQAGDPRWRVDRIDTSAQTPAQTVAAVRAWIAERRSAP